ncbi:hypothetical protein EYZ11_005744 [Aspergillus tanneri]|nr:hypothetical protein EYZ11_005744 [Aspergillus tanneri]
MSNNPYENEPGYDQRKTKEDESNMKSYAAKVVQLSNCFALDGLTGLYVIKIRHECLRLAVIEPLESALGIRTGAKTCSSNAVDNEELNLGDDTSTKFCDLRKRRFLWYFESYIRTINAAEKETSGKRAFETMPFEGLGNEMAGHFNYPDLRQRLVQVRDKIIDETHSWLAEGLYSKKQELGIAASLQRQYEQCAEDFRRQKNFTISLSLVGGNPFLWEFTYFGRPMTYLDGGIFKFKIYLSSRFPDEEPRVFIESPLFHIRVSPLGVLCYIPQRADEMRFHIEAIVAAMEEESPPYDPRTTVNPEATQLFWGSPENRKQYHRALRRSVEKSIE